MSRRIAAVLAATALAGAALATSATAAPPSGLESYAAGSTATALELNVGGADGLNLAVSRTGAVVNDGPQAAADGAALLIAGNPVPGDAPSAAPEGPESNEECAIDIDLDEETGGQLGLLDLALACVETEASIDDGAPSAAATSGELQITLRLAAEALEPILTPVLGGLTDATGAIRDGVCETELAALLCSGGEVEEITGIGLVDLLDDLVNNVADPTFVLAQITVAPTASLAGADDEDGVSGLAGANGVTIDLLPGIASTLLELGLDIGETPSPQLVRLQLGQSVASVVRDPITGEASTDGSAAQLLVPTVGEDLGVLDQIAEGIRDGLDGLAGNPLNCDADNPLGDLLCIDLGEVREQSREQLAPLGLDFGEGTVGIQSTAATIRLLPVAAEFLGGDLVTLQFATATAAANAAPVADLPAAPEEPAPPAQPDTPRDLPRTGADGLPLGVLAGMLGLAVVGGALVRRTALS